jgi:hypothetical protein
MRRCNSSVAEAIMRAGISSVPISNRKSDMKSNASFYIEANCVLPV